MSESLKGIFQFGIDSVYYVLIDKNKKRVDSIVFTPDDFHIININKIQKMINNLITKLKANG